MENEYNEEQWGALDGEDIRGYADLDSELFQQAFKATKKELEEESYDACDSQTIQWIKDSFRDTNEDVMKDQVHYVSCKFQVVVKLTWLECLSNIS